MITLYPPGTYESILPGIPITMKPATLLTVLISVYIGAEVVSNLTAGRIVAIGPFIVPGAIFLYATTFTLRDAVQVAGGFRVAKALVWGGLLANGLLALYGLLVAHLPAPQGFPTAPYATVLDQSARIVVASLTAYGVSTYLDTLVFHYLGRRLITRVLSSNLVGIVVDTGIFITLAFAGSGVSLPALMLGQLVFKLVISSLLIPLVYAVRASLRRYGYAEGY